MKFRKNCSESTLVDKSLAETLMSTLTSIKFDGDASTYLKKELKDGH